MPMRDDSPNLDLLRALAVIFVVVSHWPFSLPASITYHMQALGLLGVAIFFVHTCLVLMLSLRRQTAEFGERRRAVIFFVRRAFRIFPLSVVVVLTVSLLALTGGDSSQPGPSSAQIISNLLLVQNLTGHDSIPAALWSLPFEVQMYLFLPALYFISTFGLRSRRYILLLWLMVVASVIVAWRLGWNYHLIKYVPCFIPGVIAFTQWDSTRRRVSPSVLFSFLLIVAMIYPYFVAKGVSETLLAWPVCLALGLLLPVCNDVKSIALSGFGRLIAKYSYGIYLVHGPCIAFTFYYLDSSSTLIQCAVFVIVCGLLSFIAFHVIERPGVAFGTKISRSLVAKKAPMRS